MTTNHKYTVFVYGTLKKDQSANYLFGDNSKLIGPARTHFRYGLYDLGGFPGMVESDQDSGGVIGELYMCDHKAISRLDRYECVDAGLFQRRFVEMDNGDIAEAYFYTGRHLHELSESRKIEGGIWE
jgi:gamma-glutamylaminecyclotransferase